MKLTIITYILFTLIGYNSCSQQQCGLGKISAFTIQSNPKNLDIFDKPDGLINESIPLKGEEGIYFVIIHESKNNWLRVNIDHLNLNDVWIKAGTVGVSTRNYNGQDISIYGSPTLNSEKVDFLKGEQVVTILKVCEDWAYIKGVGENNKEVKGWLQPDMQCGDTLSTCP